MTLIMLSSESGDNYEVVLARRVALAQYPPDSSLQPRQILWLAPTNPTTAKRKCKPTCSARNLFLPIGPTLKGCAHGCIKS